MVMNKIFSIMIIISFLFPCNVFSQPLREETPEWDLIEETSIWDPVEMTIEVGETELKVWIMNHSAPAPISGYLLKKPDFGDMKRTIDNLDKEIKRIKDKERAYCDERLSEKDLMCQKLNKDLIQQIDDQKIIIIKSDDKIKSLDRELFWTKIIAGTVVLGLSGFSIYSVTK
jgi:hypothetical protein